MREGEGGEARRRSGRRRLGRKDWGGRKKKKGKGREVIRKRVES